MTNAIIVPLDGSRLAEQALPCATMLAQGLPAELVLFRAVSLSHEVRTALIDTDLDLDVEQVSLANEAKAYLDQLASGLGEWGLRVSTIVRPGPAAETILDYIRETNIQQIVMATHGYSGISRWVHGSIAERVVQSADVPVLLVRVQEDAGGVSHKPMSCHRILVPLDGSPLAEQVLPQAVAIARALGAELVLFRVLTLLTSLTFAGEWYMPLDSVIEIARQEARLYLDGVAEDLDAQGIQVSTALQVGGVANAIIEYAEANEIDLIAMSTHGRTGLARWALGSVADRVLRAGGNPLLLVRPR
jgi:nucleotide-binding universal stress UspA family protein